MRVRKLRNPPWLLRLSKVAALGTAPADRENNVFDTSGDTLLVDGEGSSEVCSLSSNSKKSLEITFVVFQ